jgi:nucleoside-diphosphate-sugar epimerase
VGKPAKIVVDPTRLRPAKSEVQRLLADNTLARERLGWEPVVPLEAGLGKTIDWIADHLDLYQPNNYQV